MLSEEGGLAAGATLISCGDLALRSTAPLNFDFKNGQLELTAATPATVEIPARLGKPVVSGKASITGSKRGTTIIAVEAGKSIIRTSSPIALAGLGRMLSAVKKTIAAVDARPTAGPVSSGKMLWSFPREKETFLSLAVGDVDGDGADETVVTSDRNHAWCLDSAGKPRWQFDAKGAVTTAALANLDGNKTKTVVVGSEDCRVYALDAAGKVRWTFEMPTYKGPGRVRVLFAADINADGYDEVIAGGRQLALLCHGSPRERIVALRERASVDCGRRGRPRRRRPNGDAVRNGLLLVALRRRARCQAMELFGQDAARHSGPVGTTRGDQTAGGHLRFGSWHALCDRCQGGSAVAGERGR